MLYAECAAERIERGQYDYDTAVEVVRQIIDVYHDYIDFSNRGIKK